ncbi:hypothetical protein [Nonomuraea sp. NPDC049480]|uniref:hypothetical protein n=1 Tax=Nonomuraea sp. NPDC049480 TaxID=3364353 RepID=UPI00379F9E52
MKRTIVGFAVVAGLAQLAASPAQATPNDPDKAVGAELVERSLILASSMQAANPARTTFKIDPVKALTAGLERGKGVNVQATAKVTYSSGMYATSSLDGTIEFDARGAAASDVAHNLRYSKDLLSRMMQADPAETEILQRSSIRMVSSGDVSYVSGPVVAEAQPLVLGAPGAATWVRYRGTDVPSGNLLLDVLEPATLETLLAHRTSVRDGVVKGTIKTIKLAAVSSSYAERYGSGAKKGRAGKISYTLWIGPDGLVERLSAKGALPSGKGSVQVESDTRYTDWGRQVAVLPPMEGDVSDKEQVEKYVPDEVPGIWS